MTAAAGGGGASASAATSNRQSLAAIPLRGGVQGGLVAIAGQPGGAHNLWLRGPIGVLERMSGHQPASAPPASPKQIENQKWIEGGRSRR